MEPIPKTAQDWLTLALDPFHDFAVPVEGAPDASIGRSYTRVYTQTANISATAAGDNVACIFTGFHGRDVGCEMPGFPSFTMAPMMVIKSASGVEPTLKSVAAGTGSLVNMAATTTDSTIPSRLIAAAIEVHDTSAAVNKQGTLVANHITGATDVRVKHATDNVAYDMAIDVHMKPLMPSTLTTLSNLPGSLIREAKDGCYMVARLNAIQPPARFGTNHHAFEYRELDGAAVLGCTAAYGSNTFPVILAQPGLADSGFNPFLVRFSGLNAASTLRVVWRTVVEFFPECDSMTNAMIATPTVPFSPRTFTAYHDSVALLPAFVPVSSNDAGDYWKMVKSAVVRAAPYAVKIAGMVATHYFGPGAQLLTNAAGDLITPRKQKKSKVNKPKKVKKGKKGKRNN